MAHVIQTQQLITVRRPVDSPDEVALDRVLTEVCRFLAAKADEFPALRGYLANWCGDPS